MYGAARLLHLWSESRLSFAHAACLEQQLIQRVVFEISAAPSTLIWGWVLVWHIARSHASRGRSLLMSGIEERICR